MGWKDLDLLTGSKAELNILELFSSNLMDLCHVKAFTPLIYKQEEPSNKQSFDLEILEKT